MTCPTNLLELTQRAKNCNSKSNSSNNNNNHDHDHDHDHDEDDDETKLVNGALLEHTQNKSKKCVGHQNAY